MDDNQFEQYQIKALNKIFKAVELLDEAKEELSNLERSFKHEVEINMIPYIC